MDWKTIQRKLEAALEEIELDEPDWRHLSERDQARRLVEIMRADTQNG
jgi:hypothetical protein